MIWKVWKEANQKPPLGAQINWASWAAKGLVFYPIFNELSGSPSDLVSKQVSAADGTVWGCSNRGNHIDFNGTTDRLDWNSIANLTSKPISVIIRMTLDARSANNQVLFVAQDAANTGDGIRFSLGGNTVTNRVYFIRKGSINLMKYTGIDAVTPGSFVQLAVTHDGVFTTAASGHIYKNAVEYACTDQNGNTETAATGKWCIGGYTFNDTANTDCKIESLSLYNTALTADQIAQLYREPYGNGLFEVHTGARIFVPTAVEPITIEPPAATGTAEVLTPNVEIGLANTPTVATGTAGVLVPQVKIIKRASEILFINPGGRV